MEHKAVVSGPSKPKFSRKPVIAAFALLFAGLGTYLVLSSLAATSTANLWVDTNGGSCTRQATAGSYGDAQACGSFDAAYEAAQCGDTIGIKGSTYPEQNINATEKDCPNSASSYITFTPA